jgi:NAD(P)-dependent dehydrogenase (short-subunit alcohol dehydrogenase family)
MPAIKDRVVVVTGSTRGFGFAIAESMLEAGATVAVTGRSQTDSKDGTVHIVPSTTLDEFIRKWIPPAPRSTNPPEAKSTRKT